MWDFRYLKDSDNKVRYASVSSVDPDDEAINTTVSGFPVQNMSFLPVNRPAKIRNIVGTTNGVVKIHFSFPAAQTIDLLALVGHNFSPDATITVYGGSSFDPATSLGTITWREGTMFKLWGSGQSYAYFKIEIDDPSNPNGDFQIGYAVLGSTTSSGVGYADYYLSKTKNTSNLTTDSGAKIGGRTFQRETIDLAFQNRSVADADTIATLFDDCVGTKERIFVIPNSDRNDGFFGTFMADSILQRYVMHDIIATQISFLEENSGICVDWKMPILRGGEPLDPEWTTSRSTTAYYKNVNLQLVQAAIDECRTSHYYYYGKPCVIIEPARTNELTYTDDFSSGWSFSNSSRTGTAIDEPKETPSTNAIKLVEDTSTDSHYLSRGSLTMTAGQIVSFSIFLKADGRYKGSTYLTNSDYFGVHFDLNAGTITDYTGGSGTVLVSEIEKYYNGWYRIKVTGICGAQTSTTFVLRIEDSSGNYTYTGDGSSGFYVWGAQYEKAFLCSSYISCTTAPTSRAYDYLYRDDWTRILEPCTGYFKEIAAGEWSSYLNEEYYYYAITRSNATSDPRIVIWMNNNLSVIGDIEFFAGMENGIDSQDEIDTTTMGTLSAGDEIELLHVLDSSGKMYGSLTVGGTTTSGTGSSVARGFPSTTMMGRLSVGDISSLSGDYRFPMLIEALKLAKGVQTLDYMRKL